MYVAERKSLGGLGNNGSGEERTPSVLWGGKKHFAGIRAWGHDYGVPYELGTHISFVH